VVFDDVHWAQPGLVDLIKRVSELAVEAPVLVICIARPELLDAHPDWGGDVTTTLEPLPETEAAALLAAMIGTDLPAETRDTVLATAAGNPLLLEELAAMLAERGVFAGVSLDGSA
jgi:predicted ATPase